MKRHDRLMEGDENDTGRRGQERRITSTGRADFKEFSETRYLQKVSCLVAS